MTNEMKKILRRPRLPKGAVLGKGKHLTYGEGACAIEWVDYLDRKRKGKRVMRRSHLSNEPNCVCPTIRTFICQWNDYLNDADRNRLLPQLLPLCLDTATGVEDQDRRAWMAADWLIRVCTPAWLDAAGLPAVASALRDLPEIESPESVVGAQSAIEAAWDATVDTTWSLAWEEAFFATKGAAWYAAWLIAVDVARETACEAARETIRCAAWSAWSAAENGVDFRATIELLQDSAVDLLRRMLCE